MSRHARVVVPEYPHHVILRGNNRRRLFSYSSDNTRFLFLLADALATTKAQMHAIAMMTNHVHLVLTAEHAVAMAATVKSVAQRYAQYRNRRRGASGKLFEERYRCFPILDTEQLGIVTCYVDANPLRAGNVQDPTESRWTTCALHAGRAGSAIPAALWTPSPWYLALGDTPRERAARYVDFMTSYAALGTEPQQVSAAEVSERLANAPYKRRLERPDRSSACEAPAPYGETRVYRQDPSEIRGLKG